MMNSKLYKLAKMVLNLAEMKTDNGVLISDSEIEVGREVFIENTEGELVAAPDGEYKAEDGKIFVVADGKVVEIREPETEEEQPEEQPEEQAEEVEQAEEQAEESEEEQTDQPDEKDQRIAELESQIAELNQVIVEKDELIGKLKAELEKSDSQPAEEQLKSQKAEIKSSWKPRF